MTRLVASTRRRPDAVARKALTAFAERFGRAATWLVVAPGRVNLIGEHTDYNGGFVLPMAIERYTAIAAAPAGPGGGPRLRVHSETVNAAVDIPLDAPIRRTDAPWANYVCGVVAGFQRRAIPIPPLAALITSDVPLGAGLSSSAALEVATATLLEAAAGSTLDPIEKARLCQKAEHEFAGVPCGLMDQLVSVLGQEEGPLLIDCRSEKARSVALGDPTVSILVADSHVRHSLGDGAYARRRAECESAARELAVPALRDATPAMLDAARDALGPVLYRRARHVVTENARTVAAAKALEAGSMDIAGSLFYESHRSLRDDYEVSCAELDVLVDIARDLGEQAGVHGARMTGGGFGGCAVMLVKTDQVGSVSRKLQEQYERRTGRTMDSFVSLPARGAHRIDPATTVPLPSV
jgi:galactokinase